MRAFFAVFCTYFEFDILADLIEFWAGLARFFPPPRPQDTKNILYFLVTGNKVSHEKARDFTTENASTGSARSPQAISGQTTEDAEIP
jgi:hypothetical protein